MDNKNDNNQYCAFNWYTAVLVTECACDDNGILLRLMERERKKYSLPHIKTTFFPQLIPIKICLNDNYHIFSHKELRMESENQEKKKFERTMEIKNLMTHSIRSADKFNDKD